MVESMESLKEYIEELKSAGFDLLRENGRLKVEREALIRGGNRLQAERNEAIGIANSILYEFEARDSQHPDTVLDSYQFLVGRDWEPFLERIGYQEPITATTEEV